MAEAIISGLVASDTVPASEIIATDVSVERLDLIRQEYSIAVTNNNSEAAAGAEYVVMAVKPQHFDEALLSIKDSLTPDHTIMTIAAGVSVTRVQGMLDRPIPVVRVMPNTPALVNAGISAVAFPPHLPELKRAMIKKILMSVGEVVEVNESDINAVTALSGSGPAYFFLFVKEMIRAGVDLGLDPDLAKHLARQTFYGSARLLEAGSGDEGDLIRAVASPGGTTEAALTALEAEDFGATILKAVSAAHIRAVELDS